MKRLISLILFLCLCDAAHSSLITVSGSVSGVWSADTVMVIGDLTVPTSQDLTIQPGVEVQFTGRWMLLVQGRLNGVGTAADSIIFTRAYPTEESKWRGIRLDGCDNATLLEYCRIEWAKGDGAYPAVHGGCLWINNCSPAVRHCRLANGYSHNGNYNGMGGGISLDNDCQSVIEYNHVVLNQADSGGGLCVGSGCNPVIRHNLIENNQGFYSGGGIYVSAGARSTICDNIIRNNTTAGYGGGGLNLWSATWLYGTLSDVYNNLITGNNGGSAGGGIYSRYESSTIHNNTITNNQATNGGGVYVLTFSMLPPVLSNNIIWNNAGTTGPQILLDPQSGSACEVTYCDVQGGWPGTGNIDAEPLFVTGPEGGFYLSQIAAGQSENSACLDAGNPISTMITGTTRTDGVQDTGVVDIGYHYNLGLVYPEIDLNLQAIGLPIYVPQNGGNFSYIATLTSYEPAPVTFEAWVMLRMPDWTWYGPLLGPVNLTLPANASLTRLRTQNVPGSAPPGLYTYHGYIGQYAQGVKWDSSNFSFIKTETDNGDLEVGNWFCSGDPFPGESFAEMMPPSSFLLFSAFPNPFNPVTTIRFNLPQACRVTLEVFDVRGRKVGTHGMRSRASGGDQGALRAPLQGVWMEAGSHEATFDGSNLPSGVYLYRLTIGAHVASGKMVLLK
jgi:hypothetical protein